MLIKKDEATLLKILIYNDQSTIVTPKLINITKASPKTNRQI